MVEAMAGVLRGRWVVTEMDQGRLDRTEVVQALSDQRAEEMAAAVLPGRMVGTAVRLDDWEVDTVVELEVCEASVVQVDAVENWAAATVEEAGMVENWAEALVVQGDTVEYWAEALVVVGGMVENLAVAAVEDTGIR